MSSFSVSSRALTLALALVLAAAGATLGETSGTAAGAAATTSSSLGLDLNESITAALLRLSRPHMLELPEASRRSSLSTSWACSAGTLHVQVEYLGPSTEPLQRRHCSRIDNGARSGVASSSGEEKKLWTFAENGEER